MLFEKTELKIDRKCQFACKLTMRRISHPTWIWKQPGTQIWSFSVKQQKKYSAIMSKFSFLWFFLRVHWTVLMIMTMRITILKKYHFLPPTFNVNRSFLSEPIPPFSLYLSVPASFTIGFVVAVCLVRRLIFPLASKMCFVWSWSGGFFAALLPNKCDVVWEKMPEVSIRIGAGHEYNITVLVCCKALFAQKLCIFRNISK